MKFTIWILLFGMFYALAAPATALESAFIENKGQWAPDVLYFAEYKGLQYWITRNSIVIDKFKITTENDNLLYDSGIPDIPGFGRAGNVIIIEFDGAMAQSSLEKERLPGYLNYITGNDSTNWVSGVRTFKKVELKNIYNGIDLSFNFEDAGMRHDFHVQPGGDPSLINYKISGADVISKSGYNSIILETALGDVVIGGVAAFVDKPKDVNKVDCSFSIESPNSVSFNVGNYDRSRELIIDPLIYSTFVGGSRFEQAKDIEILPTGEVFLTGTTMSRDFPTSAGAYSRKLRDSNATDIFVTKLDSSGKNIIFSTYIGGHYEDFAEGMEIDPAGYVYLAGYTGGGRSNNFPVTPGALDSSYNGGYDVVALKLRYDGSRLEYSTYIGGRYDDYGLSLLVDGGGYAYITGYTTDSSNYPTTAVAYSKKYKGGFEAFVTKLLPTGAGMPFSTLIGGSRDDFANDIDMDDDGNVYIAGTTRSKDFPVTSKAWDGSYNDTTLNDENGDIFISVFNMWGSQLLFSSYLGGGAKERAYGIKLDSKDNIIVAGYTESYDYPVTKNAYDTTYNSTIVNKGKGDAIITKFRDMDGSLVFSTYFGGAGTDKAFDLYLDAYDNCFITGVTGSPDFPVSFNGFDTSYNEKSAGADAFIIKTDADGRRIHYGSFYGGKGNDVGQAIKVYNGVYIYAAGTTSSPDFPVTPGILDTLYSDSLGSDAFIIKDMPYYMIVDAGSDITLCRGDTAELGSYAMGGANQITYKWEPDTWLSSANTAIIKAYPPETTTYTLTATDGTGYSYSDEVVVAVVDYPVAHITGKTKIVKGGIYTYTADFSPDYGYNWHTAGGSVIGTSNKFWALIQWDSTNSAYISLVVDNGNACFDSLDAFGVDVENIPLPDFDISGKTEFCEGDTLILTAKDGYSQYRWSNGVAGKKLFVTQSGRYWLDALSANGHEAASDTVTVTVHPTPPKPWIYKTGDSLACGIESGEYKYQWFYENEKIAFAAKNKYRPYLQGDYRVEVTDKYGCSNESDAYFNVGINEENQNDVNIRIYPNPAKDRLYIEVISGINVNASYIITITDFLGRIRKTGIYRPIADNPAEIPISSLDAGMYFISIKYGEIKYFYKFVIIE